MPKGFHPKVPNRRQPFVGDLPLVTGAALVRQAWRSRDKKIVEPLPFAKVQWFVTVGLGPMIGEFGVVVEQNTPLVFN